jgi:hypothetical protein
MKLFIDLAFLQRSRERVVNGITKTLTFSLAAIGAMLASLASADAGGAVKLDDGQLDRVTASGALVFSTADAAALGTITQASTNAGSAFGSNSGIQDGFGSEAGLATGEAVALGTAPKGCNNCQAGSATSVTTGGVPEGNYTMTFTANRTSSALGLTIQGGFTFVYGVFVPGL